MLPPQDYQFYSDPTEILPSMQIKRWYEDDTLQVHAYQPIPVHLPMLHKQRPSKTPYVLLALAFLFLLPIPYAFATGMFMSGMMDAPLVGLALIHPQTPTQVKASPPNAALKIQKAVPSYLYYPTQLYGQNGEQGVDFAAPFHSQAVAIWSGTVYRAYRTCWNTNCTSTSGGVVIIISDVSRHGTQSVYYLHLDVLYVVAKQYVHRGDIIGLAGGQRQGGNWPTSPQFSTGAHLEVGSCASFLPCPIGNNFNIYPAIERAMKGWNA